MLPLRRPILIAESDGSSRRRRREDPWHRLAIFEITGPAKYLVSIQFFAHPSKEPSQAKARFASAVQAAVFFIAHDPSAVSQDCRAHPLKDEQIRREYDRQVDALLAEFDKTAPIYGRCPR